MIFTEEALSFQILDVLYLDHGSSHAKTGGRNFDALSFRFEGDADIESRHTSLHLTDGTVTYFPSAVEYVRHSRRDRLIVVHFSPLNFQGSEIEVYRPREPERYRALFEQLLDTWNRKETAYRYDCTAILNRIFAEIYRENAEKRPPHGKIDAAVRYIEQNCLCPDFELSSAAEHAFMSEVYFRRLFREEFGMSPKQYVLQYRIRHAATLILSGYFTLQEVAERCGFRDYKHFTVQFKRIIGVSPSQYDYDFKR